LPPQQAAWIPADLEHQATMNPDVRTVAVMFDRGLVADGGDRARILAVSPLIREMMIYALRWPVDRPEGDAVSDAFFRTLANLVSEAAMAEVSVARANAAGDGAAGGAGAVGAGDFDGGGFRQPQVVYPRLHPVLRRNAVRIPQEGWRRRDLRPW
jgi:hypothetical protein